MSGLFPIPFQQWFSADTQLLSTSIQQDSSTTTLLFSYLLISELSIQFKVCDLTY
jgi:hypothetical protein